MKVKFPEGLTNFVDQTGKELKAFEAEVVEVGGAIVKDVEGAIVEAVGEVAHFLKAGFTLVEEAIEGEVVLEEPQEPENEGSNAPVVENAPETPQDSTAGTPEAQPEAAPEAAPEAPAEGTSTGDETQAG